MIRRIALPLGTIAAVTALACVDMSAPDGAASISALQLPSPSVVVGDTMRDSTGAVAPLRVTAYDANSAPIEGLSTLFFIVDTAKLAHIANSSFLVGDKQGTVRVIGQVTGVQTVPANVPVTVAPTKFALGTTKLPDTLVAPLKGSADTTTASTLSQAMVVTLKGIGDTAAVGFIVKYELLSAPATKAGAATPAVLLRDDAGRASLVDTTDASGGASRNLIVKSALLADDALKTGAKTDSVVVRMSTFYKGKPVSGSPIRVVLPLKIKL